MIAAAPRPMNPALWIGGPILICSLASLVLAAPLRIYGFALPQPVFALVPAFAWALIRPSVLPPLALFVCGLFLDLLWGGLLGLWPTCLLAAYGSIYWARANLAGRGFWILWLGYALVCALALSLGALIVGLHAGIGVNLGELGWQFLVTLALYPFAWGLLTRYEEAEPRFR